ncbi:hypothetical protein AKG39_08870 [Acetobacterium bakii]|uniref:Uncharacterized protein n=2 Tax=Acetobacterium bakii TaxID=52689 RepID=A0A0L6U129_9FIRM|nr:hypothetical protein AKG39_08870 [Acetobacterium bakii]
MTKNRLLAPMNVLYKISPKLELKLMYKIRTGCTLNLDHPVKYTEKIQWIKLYGRNELMPLCCDKYSVRAYVSSCGCGELLNELLWEGYNPGDIPFDALPDAFVIKVSHGSSFNIICEDKEKLNRNKTVATLNKWLKTKFLPCYGEWFYGIEKPRVVVEKYLIDQQTNALFVYGFYCFHGEPKIIGVKVPKNNGALFNVYDVNFNIFRDVTMSYKNDLESDIPKPKHLPEMLDYARRLSKCFIHVRVDLYYVDEKIIFGELTFTQSAGFSKILPHSFNVKMGSWLSTKDIGGVKTIRE